MRDCPSWFQDALTRVGGTNQYGEPIFRLTWEKICWALYVWEPRELSGSYERFMHEYHADGAVGPAFPKYGKHRLLQKFIHREMVSPHVVEQYIDYRTFEIRERVVSKLEVVTTRMEPCGLMLDLMLPMLMAWRKLSDSAKIAALRQEERLKNEQFLAKVKDARAGHRISRGSQLVQKRAEIIEKGFRQAMAVASRSGLGMKIGET